MVSVPTTYEVRSGFTTLGIYMHLNEAIRDFEASKSHQPLSLLSCKGGHKNTIRTRAGRGFKMGQVATMVS